MKTQIIMKKLFIILLVLGCGTQLFAQFGNPLIQNVLMSPNPLPLGSTGLLTADVRNNGATNITANCALVSISVPSSISGATLTLNTGLSDPIWVFNNYGVAGNIVLRNGNGILPGDAATHPIVLNVSGDARGGPLTIQATISLNFGCTGLGNTIPGDDNATTSLTVFGIFTWTGVVSSDWNDAGNWSPVGVPGAADKAIIPNVTLTGDFLPQLTQPVTDINDLEIQPNATVDINGQNFTINGAVTGTGTLKGTVTSNLTINGTAGTLYFDPLTNVLRNLTLNANKSATLGSALEIAAGASFGTLIVNSGATLTTGGNLTIKSNATGTARVGISAGTISGDVTVERYIANPQRAWHLLGTNTFGTQTIRDAWQEAGAVVSQKGTWLTSGATLLPGFDGNSINGASILIHDQTVPSWTTIPVNSTNATALSSRPGYFLFVRGDRSCTPANATVSPTVLRSKGALKQGTLPAVTVSATGTGRTLVGNPYASAINMESIFAGTANLDQNMLIWDPALTGTSGVGGYRAIVRTAPNTYTQTPVVLGGTLPNNGARFIHSGQAFFLKATGANAGVVFTEAVKTATPTTLYNPIVEEKGDQTIIANLMLPATGGSSPLLDGIRISYNSGYTASLTDDIEKMTNFGENLASYRSGTKLIVERRPMITAADTIFLHMNKTTAKDYRFQIGTIDFVQPDVTAFLEDTYLKTKTKLDLTGGINYADFSITSDAASANPDRFMIVFKGTPVPTTITLNAAPQGGYIAVDWKAANQNNMKQYELEKSTDGVRFTKVETKAATGANGSTVNYNWLDVNAVPGDNIYRVLYTDLSGVQKYSALAKVTMGKIQSEITIYPNPVTEKRMQVKFAYMYEGTYQLRLISGNRQVAYVKEIRHPGGTASYNVNIQHLAAGSYLLEVMSPSKHTTVISLSVLN